MSLFVNITNLILSAVKLSRLYVSLHVQVKLVALHGEEDKALLDMTSDKLQQKVCQLFYTQKYVLYNISKLLRNSGGGRFHGGHFPKWPP